MAHIFLGNPLRIFINYFSITSINYRKLKNVIYGAVHVLTTLFLEIVVLIVIIKINGPHKIYAGSERIILIFACRGKHGLI